GYRHCIEMLVLFIQHLPEILIVFCLGILFNGRRGLAIIDVAQIRDIYFSAAIKILEVVVTFSAGADGCHRKPVTGCKKASAEYMPWDNKESCRGHGGAAQEVP